MACRLYRLFAGFCLLLLALVNWRAHAPANRDEVISQLRFLGTELDAGGGERMQAMFPEGYVFSWALYGLAAAEIARQLPPDDVRRPQLLARAQAATRRIDSPAGRAPFSPALSPTYGVFYTGWRLYLQANYLRALGPANAQPTMLVAFERDCDSLAAAFARSPTPFLPSYPGSAWPADGCVGIAALGIHDQLLAPRYEGLLARWTSATWQRIDTTHGALTHAANAMTGAPQGGVRGSSLALMSRVLVDVAPALARAQYDILREQFVAYQAGVPGVREYPLGHLGPEDVDSGPLPLGFGGPATVVGAAAARVHNDPAFADALLGTVEVAGVPVEWNGRRYVGGLVPVGDAFIAWANATPIATDSAGEWERVVPAGWTWVGHTVSLALAGLLLWPIRRWRATKQAAR
jgi:hypothetical protein